MLGCACAAATAWTCALVTGEPSLRLIAAVLSAIAGTKLLLGLWNAFRPSPWISRLLGRGETAVEFALSAATGLLAAATLLRGVSADIQVLACGFAMVYAAGTAVRSAGRPFLAIGQLLIALMPILLALVKQGTPGSLLLAAIVPCMALGIGAAVLRMFEALARQHEATAECRELAIQMERLAREDMVTGLTSRAGLTPALEKLNAELPQGWKLALLWLDLHRFKHVNDALGHAVGDQLLQLTARRLEQEAPDGAVLARFGSDEFMVAVPVRSRSEAERLAAKISESLARPARIAGHRIETGAAIGVALLPDDVADLDTLMQSADLALFEAKTTGRHRVCFFDPSMTRALMHRREIEAELRSAIARDELAIYFQPIIDLDSGQIRSFEALVRWFHPEKGEIRPDEFITVAEETGLIITLGNWITTEAARTATTWPDHVTLAVNLSAVQIRAPGAALGILAALREARLDPRRLELEVTESLFLSHDEHTARFIDDLAGHGVRFALDDFGTGYSALHYINKYPFSTIKVDRSFVSGPDAGRKSEAIIRAVAEMGATLDIAIVAEGIETSEQLRTVREAGCTLGQGYYFSRAVPDYQAAMLLAQEEPLPRGIPLAG